LALLLAFSLLIRAKPNEKSLNDLVHELVALLVLNGGTFRQSPYVAPIRQSQVLVHPDWIIVIELDASPLLEIPLAKVRHVVSCENPARGWLNPFFTNRIEAAASLFQAGKGRFSSGERR